MDKKVETTFGYIRKENWFEKLVGRKVSWLIACSLLFAYPIYRSLNRTLPPELPYYSKVTGFDLTNGFGKKFGAQNLAGNVYFVTLSSVKDMEENPEFAESLKKIQKRMKGVRAHASMVTITTTPEVDGVKELYGLARKNQANPFYWSYLTGSKEKVTSFIETNFKKLYDDFGVLSETGSLQEMMKARQVILVDRKGFIRGLYGLDKHAVNKLMIDVGLLINRTKN